jgi:hypothetical protein
MLGTLTMVSMFGMLGLGIDAAYLFHLKRMAQVAADAGAKAASIELEAGSNADAVTSAAVADITTNGFTNGVNGATVVVNNPPASGRYAGVAGAVEVIVTQSTSTFFMQVLGTTTAAAKARAVGGRADSSACIYVLDPTANHAFEVSGGAALNANCGIVDDSSSSHAFNVSGGSSITATSASVVGGVEQCTGCTITGDPTHVVTGATFEADPLSGIPAPTVGACTYTGVVGHTTGVSLNGGAKSVLPSTAPAITGTGTTADPYVLNPGTYCNGITISTSNVIFNSGTYILNGGGLTSSSASSVLTGTGVTFYNTGTGGFGSYTYRPLVISGGGTANLSAPSSGTLSGILFFQDRTLPNQSSQETVSGGSSTTFEGALYFPKSQLVFSGGSAQNPAYVIIVSRILTISGSSTVNNDYSGLPLGSPIKVTGLIE